MDLGDGEPALSSVKNPAQKLRQEIISRGVLWVAILFILSWVNGSLYILLGARAQNSIERVAQAKRVNSSPKLDGDLNEALWKEASTISQFLQRDPREGEPATEKTEVKIIYTDTAIFFGVVCFDSQAEKIIANERARDDSLGSDDTFEIILDTFHNHRDGFLFRTNPLGTKFDSWIVDEGQRENSNWDERWSVAANRTEVGWVVEVEIPFKSIRMPDEKNQVWGIDFKRNIRRKNEEVVWSNYRRNFEFKEVSQAGDLVGLENISSEQTLRIKPYVTAGASRVFTGDQPETDHLFDVGLEDVKYRLTPSLTLDLTVNPDFAQADVDEQVSNLTRFPIFFPEKREFFLENASLFDFGPGGPVPDLKLFQSRRIGLSEDREPIDILAGVKLSGQLKGLELGFINVQTDDFQDTPSSNFSVIRVKQKILSRSVVGAIFTNRQPSLQDDFNRTIGFDGNFVFFDNLHLGSFFASSRTPGVDGDEWAARPLRINWQTDFLLANAEHTIIRRNLNADMGFIPRKDMKKTLLEFQIKPRPQTELIRQLLFGTRLRYITDQENVLETREQELDFNVIFESGDRLIFAYVNTFEFLQDGFLLRGQVPVPPGTYAGDLFKMHLIPYDGRKIGGFFNFQRENGFWGGSRTSLGINPWIKWSGNLSFEIEYAFDRIELPNGEFSSNVSNVRINYNFTNNWLTSTTIQRDNIEDLVNINFRLNYIYRPGDDLFVVYNQTRRMERTDRAFILKFTHSFDF